MPRTFEAKPVSKYWKCPGCSGQVFIGKDTGSNESCVGHTMPPCQWFIDAPDDGDFWRKLFMESDQCLN